MQRRNFLKIVGGGVVLAAVGAGAFLTTRTPEKALAPWKMAGDKQYDDPRLNALSYAILSPNPHNRQPWIVELIGNDALTLRFDTDKQLPETDPFDRQLTIGLGCFVELMTMAAGASGYAVDLDLFPEGMDGTGLDKRIVAHARFSKDDSVKADPLWAHVMERRSNKQPFDTERPVEEEKLRAILASSKNGNRLGGTVDVSQITAWRKLTEEAMMIELATPRTYRESVELFRIGKAEVEANPDGIDFSGALFDTMAMTGLFTRETALDTQSTAYAAGIDAVMSNIRTANGYVWMVSEGNTRIDQIKAGGDWLRANLAATSVGLGFHPLSQPLQEYPEMAEIYETVHKQLAPQGGTVQMLVRIGYAPVSALSPRWPLDAKLV